MLNRRTVLTVENALYLAIFVLALALRLYNLGVAPLHDSEAHEALTVYRVLRGIASEVLPHSPAYFSFTFLSFLLFGALDPMARLPAALFGSALTLLPLLYRDQLGRAAALGASVLLALSAGLLAASRTADGGIIAVFALAAGVGALRRYHVTGATSWLVGGAVAFGLGVATGAAFITGALILALTVVATTWANTDDRTALDTFRQNLQAHGRTFGIAFGLATLLFACAALIYPFGVSALTASWSAWLNGFSSTTAPSPMTLFTFLIVYEPLAVIFGLVGFAYAFARGHRWAQALGWFSLIGLVILAFYGGRTIPALVWVIAPLHLLAAWGIIALISDLPLAAERPFVAIQVSVLGVLLSFALFNFAAFAEQVKNNPAVTLDLSTGSGIQLALTGLALALAAVVSYLFGMGWSWRVARWGVALSLTAVLSAMGFSAAWGLTQLRPTDPAELWWTAPTAMQLERLLNTVRDTSNYHVGNDHDIEIIAQAAPDGALAWALRDFPHTTFVKDLDAQLQVKSPIVIAPEENQNPALGSSYAGQDFVASSTWNTSEMTWQQWLGWWAFRRGTPQTQHLILWVRQDVQQLQSAR